MTVKDRPEILIIYDSKTGNTKKMSEFIKDGAEEIGVKTTLKSVIETEPNELLDYHGIIVGSPTYYGLLSAKIKDFFDRSVEYHSKLEGKVGAAFATSGVLGGGTETTIWSILDCLLVHGMIIQGDAVGGHYGAVAIGKPGEKETASARRLGKRTAMLIWKLFATKE